METGTLGARETEIEAQLLEAREQERAMLAAELHDGPAQSLANIGFQVQIIERALSSDPAAARTELMQLRQDLERELSRMREFIHQLHPTLEGEEDFAGSIDELANQLRRGAGVVVDVELGAPIDGLGEARLRAILRVAQEALRNVRKHAHATRVLLATFIEPGEGDANAARWILQIADNGRGFAVDEVLQQGSNRNFGLRFMRERAQLIGARLEIVSSPSVGTTVRLALEPAKRS